MKTELQNHVQIILIYIAYSTFEQLVDTRVRKTARNHY